MKKFKLNVPERKELVTRLVDLTGQRARYTFMPRCAYEVGGYSVEKDGDVMVSENVNPEDLQTLLNEGWIVPDGADTTEEARIEPAALQDTVVEQPALDPDDGGEESEEQSDAESEDTDDAAPEDLDDVAPEAEASSEEDEITEQETEEAKDRMMFDVICQGKAVMSYAKVSHLAKADVSKVISTRRKYLRDEGVKMRQYKPRPKKEKKSEQAPAAPLEVGIKEMPAFDPYMEFRGLMLTIPTWINAIARARGRSNIEMVSGSTREQLANTLRSLEKEIMQTLEVIEQ